MMIGMKTIFDIGEEKIEKQDNNKQKKQGNKEKTKKFQEIEKEIESTKKIKNKDIVLTSLSGTVGAISLIMIYPKGLEMNDYALAAIGGAIGMVCTLGCGHYISKYEKEVDEINKLQNKLPPSYKKTRKLKTR